MSGMNCAAARNPARTCNVPEEGEVKKDEVLLVDDNKMMRDTLQGYLEAQGYRVSACEDGPSALILASEKHFDIVLTDFQLPQMNGDEMVCLLRQQRSDRFIVGFSLGNKERAFLEAGADQFISKDQLLTDLIPAIEKRTRSCLTRQS